MCVQICSVDTDKLAGTSAHASSDRINQGLSSDQGLL